MSKTEASITNGQGCPRERALRDFSTHAPKGTIVRELAIESLAQPCPKDAELTRLAEENARLKEQLEVARKDTERLDMIETCAKFRRQHETLKYISLGTWAVDQRGLRAAIDSEMRKNDESQQQ